MEVKPEQDKNLDVNDENLDANDKNLDVNDENLDVKDEELDAESALSDSFIVDSDSEEEASVSKEDDEKQFEEPLTEQEIEELVAEFLEVESKAAEAQEALEKESLAKLESEVREELAQILHANELEAAVKSEMTTYEGEWEAVLDELETESAHLLEQLDGAGIELPKLYKWIESQAPKSCCTEAWKRRAHWVGSQVSSDITEAVANAEEYLQTHRPVRRRHGKLLEEGASGFLQKKIAVNKSEEATPENGNVDWESLKQLFSGSASKDGTLFGSKHWASVYLANTPQEAAAMGLKFPGVNEVEEIDDIDGTSSDPFVAEAIENEKELVLSEEQKKNYRKVKEEYDVQIDRKLRYRLKQRRCRKRSKQIKKSNVSDVSPLDNDPDHMSNERTLEQDAGVHGLEKDLPESSNNIDKKRLMSNGSASSTESGSSKRPHKNEGEELETDLKKPRTVDVDSDNDTGSEELETNGNARAKNHSSLGLTEGFHCTACDSVAVEVHRHPLLKVIVCKSCRCQMEKKLYAEDMECSECYCAWCGRNSELVSCKSCKTLFCTTCIRRNIGEEYLSKVKATGWNCCRCSPTSIKRLTSELEKFFGSDTSSSSDSDTENSDTDTNVVVSSKSSSKRKRKKKIRRILDDAELGEDTQKKIAIEKERQERLKSLQGQFSNKSNTLHFTSFKGDLPEGAGVEVLGDAATGFIVNVVREKGEEAVRIPPSISAKLKTHQVAGIRFLWENIIQSIGKVMSGDRGLGCILAHTMGLGKTFQVIAFLYTAMRSVDLGLKTALIVTPVNVLHNWRQEFMKWKPSEVKSLRVYMLEDVSRERRAELFAKWRAKGGVFLIGYNAFRNLSQGKHVKDRNMAREICYALQDGPDILVCDEAHMIKNTRADTTQALKQVKCQRRIALTGSPLQNNLMEYYCMVDFVREGFLGSSLEFRNRFQNPIVNGQHTNSTAEDVKIMNQRSHILYEQLKGFVQRMDMSVVKKDLPPKTVFVIAVNLSTLQRKLYKRFLDVHGFTKDKATNEKIRRSFFAGYQALAQIWNHPGILHLRKDKDYSSREDTVENFLADDSSGDENLDYNTMIGEKSGNENDYIHHKNEGGFFVKGWWNDLLNEHNYKELDYSGKMVLLLDILTMSSHVGDKALVFSQSIPTLDLIELYLSRLPRPDNKEKVWKKGKDWYRLDGRTESSERQKLVEKFNDPDNRRVKCTLISTRAGSLGINLHAANRVIIVDGSWNPTFDLQAIYRAWRYGQKKPVFAYRLMAHGTMEEKIYKRQVTKEGLAARVVDRQQVHRTISKEELIHLFEFGDDENPEAFEELGQEDSHQMGNGSKKKVPLSHGSCSSDRLMENLLSKHYARWIANYHEHETLLQENEEEKLTKEEQDMAWEVYRKSLQWEEVPRGPTGESTYDKIPSEPNTAPAPTPPTSNTQPPINLPPRSLVRNRKLQRKCTNLAHLLTLRSQGTKYGCTTVCGECACEISWEDLKKDGNKAAS